MLKRLTPLVCLLLLLAFVQLPLVQPAHAGDKEERIKLLQEKMKKLKKLLVLMEEEKVRETPPKDPPWEPLLDFGLERPAYDQYAYLIAPQMSQEKLDSILQQLYFFASQDDLKARHTLFVIPTLPLDEGETMSVTKYNRDLAVAMLHKIGVPSALEGGILVTPNPLGEEGVAKGPQLFIDLAGCDQILRLRIFEQLQKVRLFAEDGSIQNYLWALLRSTDPQAFTVSVDGERMWLAVDND